MFSHAGHNVAHISEGFSSPAYPSLRKENKKKSENVQEQIFRLRFKNKNSRLEDPPPRLLYFVADTGVTGNGGWGALCSGNTTPSRAPCLSLKSHHHSSSYIFPSSVGDYQVGGRVCVFEALHVMSGWEWAEKYRVHFLNLRLSLGQARRPPAFHSSRDGASSAGNASAVRWY